MKNNGSSSVLRGITAALVALIAISATASPAHAVDDAGPKQQACGYLGCPGTEDRCADISAKVSIPGVGEVSVTYYCKEGEGDKM